MKDTVTFTPIDRPDIYAMTVLENVLHYTAIDGSVPDGPYTFHSFEAALSAAAADMPIGVHWDVTAGVA